MTERSSIGSGSTSTSKNASKPSSTWRRHSGSRMREAGRSPLLAFEHWSQELFAIHGLDALRHGHRASQEYHGSCPPDDREFVAREIQTMLTEQPRIRLHEANRAPGRVDSSRTVRRHAGDRQRDVPAVCRTGIDVTEHEEFTTALRKSEQELRQTLDFAP